MLDQHCALIVVTLPGELDLTTQDHAYDRLYAAFVSGASVVVADFTATGFCGCSAMRHVLSVRHRAAARNAQLRLVIPPSGQVRRLAQLMGVDRHLQVYPSLAQAVNPSAPNRIRRKDLRHLATEQHMADIIDLIRLDHLHITRWAARLGELGRPPGPQVSRAELTTTWQILANLLTVHMSAEDEICTPAIFGTGPQCRTVARAAKDARDDIREIIRETSLQPPGSPLWWHLARTVLAAWAVQIDQEDHGPIAECRRRVDSGLREQLAGQWRIFTEAQIRDLYPQAPPQIPTHRLCQDEPVPSGVPRLADPSFGPLVCTCQACTGRLSQGLHLTRPLRSHSNAWPGECG